MNPSRVKCTPLVLVLLCTACSVKKAAVNAVADSLANGPDVFGSDEDLELVRDSLPFALKAVEALMASAPENEDLLLTACRGFTQYSFAFVEVEADFVELEDWEEAERMRERALKLYLRARNYGLRGLELHSKGISERLTMEPIAAVQDLDLDAIAMAYWTASAWGSAIGLGLDRPDLIADVDVARALIQRALELDEDWDLGAIHEAMIVVESFPEAMGGSPERARKHFLARGRAIGGSKRESICNDGGEELRAPPEPCRVRGASRKGSRRRS